MPVVFGALFPAAAFTGTDLGDDLSAVTAGRDLGSLGVWGDETLPFLPLFLVRETGWEGG